MTFVRDTLLHEISCLLANWFRRTRPYFFVPFCLNLLESRTGGFQRLLQVPWGYFPSSAKAQREYEVIDPNGSQPLQQGSNTPLGVCKPEEAESSRRRFTDPCCYVTALFLRGFGRSPIPSTHSFTSARGRGQLSSLQSGAGAFSCWGILHLSLRVSLNVLLKTTHAGCTPLVGGPQPSALRVKGLWDVASAGPYPQEQRNHILALSLPDVPNPHNSPGLLQSSGHACLCTRGAVTRALFSLQGLLPRTCSPHAVGR